MQIQNTKFYSKRIGSIAAGCRQCVQGRKLVLFVTGVCSKKCWFCPLSEQKMKKDVIFANEWQLEGENDIKKILKEAKLCESYGAGITGGDPFARLSRTVKYIRLLKKTYGKKFHIHLYAPLEIITKDKLTQLYKAGLNEIRIHPDFFNTKHWYKIELLNEFGWDIGMEIPVIPGYDKQTKQMIDYFANKLKFLNLNELEISDTNMDEMSKRRFKPKAELSYAVKGSEELAIRLMQRCIKKYPKLNVHYCTTKLKDAVQLAKRMKLRSKNAATKYDKITGEGMLVRNCVYLEELKPGFGYRKKLNAILADKRKKAAIIKKLKTLKIKDSILDELKLRLLVKDLSKVKAKGIAKAKVEEYPTSDGMELTVTFK